MATLYYPPTQNALQKTLGSTLAAGETTSATLNNTTGLQNKPGIMVIDRVDTTGAETATKREYIPYTGISGSTVTGLTRNVDGGSSDQEHAVGAIVEFIPDITWAQAINDVITTEHNADGTHGSTIVTTTGTQALTNKTITSGKFNQLTDTNGNEVIKFTATSSAVNEITEANAATGNNPTTSATGDDSNVGWDIKMKGTGVMRKPTVVGIQVVDSGTNTATGDAKAYFRVPAELNGMNLTRVNATVYTAGTTNTTDVQIRNKTDSVDMLSTKMTIDSGETDTSTAATAAVIDTTKDDVVTGDVLAIDVDAVSTTPAKGLYVELQFQLP